MPTFACYAHSINKVHYFKRPYLAVAAVLALLGLATAQSIAPDEMHAHTVPYLPPSTVTLRTQVNLVEVPVVVRDGMTLKAPAGSYSVRAAALDALESKLAAASATVQIK